MLSLDAYKKEYQSLTIYKVIRNVWTINTYFQHFIPKALSSKSVNAIKAWGTSITASRARNRNATNKLPAGPHKDLALLFWGFLLSLISQQSIKYCSTFNNIYVIYVTLEFYIKFQSELKIVLVYTWKKNSKNCITYHLKLNTTWILAWAFSPKVEFIHRFSRRKCIYRYTQEKKHFKHKSEMLTSSSHKKLNVYRKRSWDPAKMYHQLYFWISSILKLLNKDLFILLTMCKALCKEWTFDPMWPPTFPSIDTTGLTG